MSKCQQDVKMSKRCQNVKKISNCQKDVKLSKRCQVDKCQKWPCDGPRWFKLKRCQNVKKMSKCQKDVKCQKDKHTDYGGGSQKNNKFT